MKKSTVNRVSLALDDNLLSALDAKMAEAASSNRSEFVRELLRDYLVNTAWQSPESVLLNTLAAVSPKSGICGTRYPFSPPICKR